MYKYSSDIFFGGVPERNQIEDPHRFTIINVCNQSTTDSDFHIPLADGQRHGGNSQQQFAKAVNLTREAIQSQKPVFIHCAVGMSRSVCVLATALAVETDQDFHTIIDTLMNIRGSHTEPAKSLQRKADKYIRHSTL